MSLKHAEKDLITMQLLKLLAVLRRRFGRKAFEPNLAKNMREHLNSENRIGFIGLVVCFDLLDPKFLIRARRLKKGAAGGGEVTTKIQH